MEIVNAKEFMMLAKEEFVTGVTNLIGKQRDGITEEQKQTLRNLGIGHSQLKYKGEASPVIKVGIERRKSGLATPGQMRAMHEMGVTIVHKRTFREASYILDGGDPDTYDELLIMIIYDTNTAKGMKVTATTRKEAERVYQRLTANGARNFRFKTIG